MLFIILVNHISIYFFSVIKRRIKMEQPKQNLISFRSRSCRSKKKLLKKELRQKENGFVLDCLNTEKSKLKVYHSISDKNLNYFVIRAHPNSKKVKQQSLSFKSQKLEKVSHMRFQEMLKRQKQKILISKNTSQAIKGYEKQQTSTDNNNQPSQNSRLLDQIKRSIKFRPKEIPIQQQRSFAEDSL